MKLMNEKASLIERIQELEHITVQLSMETETIGKEKDPSSYVLLPLVDITIVF